MPIITGHDKDGYYYRWGNSGTKYHYDPKKKESRERARKKAGEQAKASYASGYKDDSK